MDLVGLNPCHVLTSVGDLAFRLRYFDLRAVVWAESFFSNEDRGELNVMYYVLDHPEEWDKFAPTVANIAFYLSEGLEIKTFEEFAEKINASNASRATAILKKAIDEVLERSFPVCKKDVVTGGEIFNKSVQNKDQKSTDWANIYADFYRFGGMTLDQFYSLTMLQVDAIYTQIVESQTREKIELMQLQCGINGIPKKNWPKMPRLRQDRESIDPEEMEAKKNRFKKLFTDTKWAKS